MMKQPLPRSATRSPLLSLAVSGLFWFSLAGLSVLLLAAIGAMSFWIG